MFLAWHNSSQRLFVGMEFVDDVFEPAKEGWRWSERIDFAIDGDHSGEPYSGVLVDESTLEEGSNAQWYEIGRAWLPEVDPLVQRWIPSVITPWAYQEPWFEIGVESFGENPTHSVVEFSLTPWDRLSKSGPEASQRSLLQADRFIGFQIRIIDEEPENNTYVLGNARSESPGKVWWEYSSEFVDGVLIPCNVLDCSGATTPVSPDSWARIKATLGAVPQSSKR